MAIPNNDRLPDEIEDVLREYEELLGEKIGVGSSISEPDINTFVIEVMSEIQLMRDSEPFRTI
ncbi:MAG TPA: hypothetical protein VH500_15910 [Nitrososphaeraceae archaeon]|jgi:hypothetical protein